MIRSRAPPSYGIAPTFVNGDICHDWRTSVVLEVPLRDIIMLLESTVIGQPVVETGNDPVEKKVNTQATGLPLAQGMSLSYWLQGVRNNPLLDHRSTETLPATADIVIIGSGITGSLAALRLLESPNPPTSVVVLEARELCSAATGRNAGHCKPDQYRGFAKYKAEHGEEQALKQETWEKLTAFVKDEGVDCDLCIAKTVGHGQASCPDDQIDVHMTEKLAAEAAAVFQAYKKAGGKVDHITVIEDAKEAERSTYAWDAATLYPWKLVAHITQKALALGLNLQTWTPVTGVVESTKAGQWTVKTARGDITTPTVVHATNAYAGYLLPEVKGSIRPTPHMCNKVIPPTSFSGSKGLKNSYAVVYPGGMFSVNPRANSDGIVLVGGSNPNNYKLLDYVAEDPTRRTDDSLTDFEPVTDAVKDLTQHGFGCSAVQARYDYAWSGIIGRSADSVPFVGAVPGRPGQWMCAGHNGHGMARIFTVAPALVKLMQGASWSDIGIPECFQVTKERLDKWREATLPAYAA
ncbi:hypothetical protein P7C73_g5095, partial [Tremellales sp. Uapishka_1]